MKTRRERGAILVNRKSLSHRCASVRDERYTLCICTACAETNDNDCLRNACGRVRAWFAMVLCLMVMYINIGIRSNIII